MVATGTDASCAGAFQVGKNDEPKESSCCWLGTTSPNYPLSTPRMELPIALLLKRCLRASIACRSRRKKWTMELFRASHVHDVWFWFLTLTSGKDDLHSYAVLTILYTYVQTGTCNEVYNRQHTLTEYLCLFWAQWTILYQAKELYIPKFKRIGVLCVLCLGWAPSSIERWVIAVDYPASVVGETRARRQAPKHLFKLCLRRFSFGSLELYFVCVWRFHVYKKVDYNRPLFCDHDSDTKLIMIPGRIPNHSFPLRILACVSWTKFQQLSYCVTKFLQGYNCALNGTLPEIIACGFTFDETKEPMWTTVAHCLSPIQDRDLVSASIKYVLSSSPKCSSLIREAIWAALI